jgi:uncharacterized protein
MRLVCLVLLTISLVVMAACSGGDATRSARPQFLSIGTAPPGGAFFVVGGALAQVLNEHRGAENWNVTAESTMGSQENIRRLVTGELHLALSNAAITYFAVRGGEEWQTPQPVQSVMTLAPNIALFVTPANSGIRRIPDLKGKRVVIGPPGAGFEYFVRPLLAAHGVTYDNFTALQGTQAAAVDMLADGSAAAAFLGGAVPTASITQASATQSVHFIPFDEEARNRLVAEYPFFSPADIPAGTYRGQSEVFRGLDVGSMHLITAANQDEEMVYRVTRALYENRAAVAERHPAGQWIRAEAVVRPTGTEFHPGAIRYYREIGIWPEKDGAGAATR